MPNSANRNNSGGNANKGQPKHDVSRSSSDKPNPERSDLKNSKGNSGRKGDPDRTSNQGRKEASGGSAED
ncbi:hypothetical protein HRG84_07010 [Flavisolibacter sp. BT320]|nr:hypothetical protein [Flavisolibacter longurius]